MRKILAISAGKLIAKTTQTLKIGGGTAAPGLYALKIDPHLVAKLSKKVPLSIVITGTNGKTTTARMLTHFAQNQGLKVLRNATGSNLERGVASALIDGVGFNRNKYDLAIWELDEAAFNNLIPKINPKVIVFLNVFRDQLDRYGEIDSVVNKWCNTLHKLNKDTTLLVNGDDHNLHQLKRHFSGPIQYFGLEDRKIEGEKVVDRIKQENLGFAAGKIRSQGLGGTSFEVKTATEKFKVALPVPGTYHVYDFLAAFACSRYLNLPTQPLISSLKEFSPAFGRVEKISLKRASGKAAEGFIFLIKNPAGASLVFQTLQPDLKPQDRLLMALNDRFADGTDVSWIWDANFEQLAKNNPVANIFVSGTRASDLALRLKYAGFDPTKITVENDLNRAFHKAKSKIKGRLFILPTYTALLHLQKILAASKIKEHYWKAD